MTTPSDPLPSAGSQAGASLHQPVLEAEVITHLNLRPDARIIDATVGLGGHTEAILRAAKGATVLGIDRDRDSLALAQRRLAPYAGRFQLRHGNFADMATLVSDPFRNPDAVLFDLGISSWQLAERGLSFQDDRPLDFRLDTGEGETAAELVSSLPERELADLIYRFGEEPRSRRIAKAIVQERRQEPIRTTGRLADIVSQAAPRRGRLHPATKTFQALRIAVNDELGSLERGLAGATTILKPEGRLVVISFHSLEDRIVKRHIADSPVLRAVVKRVVRPAREEVMRNSRSRSAKLRVAERLPRSS